MRHGHNNRGGFALLTAIIMLTLLGIALAAMSAQFAYQAKRTRDLRRDAQLRQLLLAGADAVAERAIQWQADVAEQNWTVQLPTYLADNGASLALSVRRPDAGATNMTAIVRAMVDGQARNQTLTLTRAGGRWHITQARLGQRR